VDQFIYSESGENKSYPWTVHSDDMTNGFLWSHSRHVHKTRSLARKKTRAWCESSIEQSI